MPIDDSADPSAGHLALLAAYTGGVAAAAAALGRRRRITMPTTGDVVLLGIATYKLSRLVTRERVTKPLRTPFVEAVDDEQEPGVGEEPHGGSLRRAIGELLTCPFCASVWIGTAGTLLLAAAPRAARLGASGLASMAVADAAQYGLAGLKRLEG